MEVLPLPRCCPTLRGLLLGTPIPNKCTLQASRGVRHRGLKVTETRKAAEGTDKEIADDLAAPNHAEAREWLQRPAALGWKVSVNEMRTMADELYAADATTVYVIGIEQFQGREIAASPLGPDREEAMKGANPRRIAIASQLVGDEIANRSPPRGWQCTTVGWTSRGRQRTCTSRTRKAVGDAGDRGDDATIATRSLPVGASSLIAALSSAPALVAIAMMNAPNSRMNRIGVSSMAHLRERGNGRETIMRRLHAGCVVALPRLTRLGVGDVKHSRSPGPQGGR